MRYLQDTTVLVPYLAGDQPVVDLVIHLTDDGIAVSINSYLEVWQGTIDVSDPASAQRRVEALFMSIPLLPVDIAVARRCAELRSFLKRQCRNPRKRAFDLVIAATALEHDLELVTHNTKDFADIPNLVRYQW